MSSYKNQNLNIFQGQDNPWDNKGLTVDQDGQYLKQSFNVT